MQAGTSNPAHLPFAQLSVSSRPQISSKAASVPFTEEGQP